jgi:hypothetical protein
MGSLMRSTPVDTAALVADLVEPARVVTHEQLDEGYRAFTIATGWLRSKASSSAGVVVETGDTMSKWCRQPSHIATWARPAAWSWIERSGRIANASF